MDWKHIKCESLQENLIIGFILRSTRLQVVFAWLQQFLNKKLHNLLELLIDTLFLLSKYTWSMR